MATGRHPVAFGANVDPAAAHLDRALAQARLAEDLGYDLVGIQDHPYNPTFGDTWTLFAAIGAQTTRLRLLPNVLNLPLRPPAMLAKAAATLDLLTGGRFELGLGAGAFWDGIASYGGPTRTPGEAVAALTEAMAVIRAAWQPPARGRVADVAGQHYQFHAQPGPAPAHPIGIWLGVNGPRMLRLTGAQADGWLVSATYVPPEEIPARQAIIDAAARAAGRDPHAIRRAYNLAGLVLPPVQPQTLRAARPGVLVAPAERWVETLVGYYRDLHLDTFVYWPVGDDKEGQFRLFAEGVIPAVRAALNTAPA
jgi:alkanesulfonate monooxygenase SsuD/methylene tetrahydromethanopterin reductase-like flavin-dependent oxidoreductase (luciferase family)